jgi:hypothetical protein
MALQNWKTNRKPSQHTDSRGPAYGSLTLPQTKGVRQRNEPPVNQLRENPIPNQDSCGLQSWSPKPEENIQTTTATPHWGRSSPSSCHWKTEEKLVRLPNHLARLRQSFCLNNNTRTWCRRSNTRTTKTEILLFLNLQFFSVFVCLICLLFVCVCLFISTHWFLCFVLLVLLLWVS